MRSLKRIVQVACLSPYFLFASQSAAAPSAATGYPNKPVHLIVPTAPGAGADHLARLVADALGKTWGQSVVVENRPGASSMIGTAVATRAEPDGYTLLFTWTALLQSSVQKTKPPYDIFGDLAPIREVARSSFVLIANRSVAANNAQELVAMAKQKPGEINYGSYGNGTSAHILGERLKQNAQIDMVHVPYKGGGPLLTALQGGEVSVAFLDFASARPAAGNPRLKILGITSAERSPYFSSTPTFNEQGIVGLDLEGWFGLLAPKGVDPAIVEKIARDATKALSEPEVRRKFEDLGVALADSNPKAFEEKLRADEAKWTEIIKASSIRID